MSIKSLLIDYLKSVANNTSEVDIKKDLIPLVMQKNMQIRDNAQDALRVGKFVSLLLLTIPEIKQHDPELKTLLPLHNRLEELYEKGSKLKYTEQLRIIEKSPSEKSIKKSGK